MILTENRNYKAKYYKPVQLHKDGFCLYDNSKVDRQIDEYAIVKFKVMCTLENKTNINKSVQ